MSEYVDLIGKPFEKGGRGPDAFDCYGVLREMHRRNGIILPDYKRPEGPEENQQVALLIAGEVRLWEQLPGPQEGAAVAIRIGRQVSHVGYMVDELNMLHAWHQCGGVTLEPVTNWGRRVEGFYRFIQ